jgi:hypothetical protein
MRKRKYEAKTGEEILQHASRYLFDKYWKQDEEGWRDGNAKEAQRIIRSLLRDLEDGNK